jgi:hypothetical protein
MKTRTAPIEGARIASRVAPAAIFTFTDVAGDAVPLKTSKRAATPISPRSSRRISGH